MSRKSTNWFLEKELRDAERERAADLSATFTSIGSRQHRLKVFNRGRALAYHVNIDFPEGNELVMRSDVDRKFPLEVLERGPSVELMAARVIGSPGKMPVRLRWEDEDRTPHEKVGYPTR